MSRDTKKKGLKPRGQKNGPSMLRTCPAAFFFQDIISFIYAQGPLVPVLVPVALVGPPALLVPVLALLVLPGPGPPLPSWQAQAVSSLALMDSRLMLTLPPQQKELIK